MKPMALSHTFRRFLALSALCSVLSVTRVGMASSAKLPPVLQAALIAKIIHLDEVLAGDGLDSAKLVLLDAPRWHSSLVAVKAALKPAGITTEVLEPEAFKSLKGVSAVYLSADAPLKDIAKLCARDKILSIAHGVELAEEGFVSVAIGVTPKGRPQVVVNTTRLAAEGHRMSKQMLQLARVVE